MPRSDNQPVMGPLPQLHPRIRDAGYSMKSVHGERLMSSTDAARLAMRFKAQERDITGGQAAAVREWRRICAEGEAARLEQVTRYRR